MFNPTTTTTTAAAGRNRAGTGAINRINYFHCWKQGHKSGIILCPRRSYAPLLRASVESRDLARGETIRERSVRSSLLAVPREGERRSPRAINQYYRSCIGRHVETTFHWPAADSCRFADRCDGMTARKQIKRARLKACNNYTIT